MRAGGTRLWAIAEVAGSSISSISSLQQLHPAGTTRRSVGRSGITPRFGAGPGCGPRGTTLRAGPGREIFTASSEPNESTEKHHRRGRSRRVFETQVPFYHPADGDTITDEDESPWDTRSRPKRCEDVESKGYRVEHAP